MVRFFVGGYISNGTLYAKKHEKYCNYFVDSFCFHILPNTEKFKNLAALDEGGYIIAGEDCVTSTPGIFAAGDITGKPYQIMKAVGEGQVAALGVASYLSKNN